MGFKSSFIAISSITKIYLSELLLETGLKCHAEKKKTSVFNNGQANDACSSSVLYFKI